MFDSWGSTFPPLRKNLGKITFSIATIKSILRLESRAHQDSKDAAIQAIFPLSL